MYISFLSQQKQQQFTQEMERRKDKEVLLYYDNIYL